MSRNTPRPTVVHVALMLALVAALGVMVSGVILVDWRLIVAPVLAWLALAVLAAVAVSIADRRADRTAPREQCTGNAQSPSSLGPPERCVLDAGHDGDCAP